MSEEIVYFAFGSNLHVPQMNDRCPGCAPLQPAVLEDYRLSFRGHSQRWGGGVATVEPLAGAQVHGLLYRLSPAQLELLNGFESYPTVYDHLNVRVTARDGTPVQALTYHRIAGDPRPPSLRYFHQIWRGYRAHALDDGLLLEAVEHSLNGTRSH